MLANRGHSLASQLLRAVQFYFAPISPLAQRDSLLCSALAMVASGEIWSNLQISLVRVFTGFGIGLLGGLVLGSVMGLSPTARDDLYPLFKAFAQVPVIGWLPLLMLLVGIDEALKFLLIAKATLVPVTLNTCQGIQGVSNRFIEVARVYGFTRWQMLTRVVFPAATAPIWNGVRYGLRVPGDDVVSMYENTRAEGFGPEVRRRVLIGTYVLSAGYYDAYYVRAQKIRTLIKRDFDEAWSKVDIVLTPATPGPAAPPPTPPWPTSSGPCSTARSSF